MIDKAEVKPIFKPLLKRPLEKTFFFNGIFLSLNPDSNHLTTFTLFLKILAESSGICSHEEHFTIINLTHLNAKYTILNGHDHSRRLDDQQKRPSQVLPQKRQLQNLNRVLKPWPKKTFNTQPTPTNMQVEHKENSPYYKHLPELFKLASMEDFFNEKGQLKMEKPYLIHSEINPKIYWCFRTSKDFFYRNSFLDFMEKQRIYVLKDPLE